VQGSQTKISFGICTGIKHFQSTGIHTQYDRQWRFNNEIADKLFISVPTVNTHRKSLLEKLEAKNTAILIGRATKLGLI